LLGKRLPDDVLVAGLKQEGRFLPHKVWQSKGSTVLTMNLMVTGRVQFGTVYHADGRWTEFSR
jgi:hypothetical protein